MCASVCKLVHACVPMCGHVWWCVSVHVRVSEYMCLRVCMYARACVCACVHACVHVCSVNLCDSVWENRPLCLDYESLVPH